MRSRRTRFTGNVGTLAKCGSLCALITSMMCASRADACGGLFCSSSSPVRQTAERIIFVDNGDGTVTAVVEILYDGPAEEFSWLLPVPGVPEIGLSSSSAFDALQSATDPRYIVDREFLPCGDDDDDEPEVPLLPLDKAAPGDVLPVLAGSIGPYDYDVIDVSERAENSGQLAIDWLEEYGYDVTSQGEEVLGDYLGAGLNLLALRLNKNVPTGSIRPIVLTYEASHPVIPIRPTAVAAEPDTGVMVWVMGEHRAVPDNYLSLELNEAALDWTRRASNYDALVTAAADEAGGHGFVTEMSDSTKLLRDVVFTEDEDYLGAMAAALDEYVDFVELFVKGRLSFMAWDGFGEVMARTVPLPEGLDQEDLQSCLWCLTEWVQFVNLGEVAAGPPPLAEYTIDEDWCRHNGSQVVDEATVDALAERNPEATTEEPCVPVMATDGRPLWDPERFLEALDELVLEPMRQTQALLDSQPTFTRLYTTLSPSEMTVDPQFTFNPDLEPVSNVHTRQMLIDCDGHWQIDFGNYAVVGTDGSAWPLNNPGVPANARIVQHAAAGEPLLLEDNREQIDDIGSRTERALLEVASNDVNDGSGRLGACGLVASRHENDWLSWASILGAGAWLVRRRARARLT